MKELSIEEKAKAYDEAIERAKKHCADYVVETIFPELKESEGEKVRKALIEMVHDTTGDELWVDYNVHKEDALDWLEKQGEPFDDNIITRDDEILQAISIGLTDAEKDLGWSDFGGLPIDEIQEWLEKQGEQKPTDKVEPKFKIGDFIVNDYCMGRIVEITNDAYLLDTGQGIPFSCEHNAHLWTIQDAKNGDVLASELSDSIILFKSIEDNNIQFYCDYDFSEIDVPGDRFSVNNSGQHYGSVEESEDFHPATKVQRDTLFAKIQEAGYEWLEETKELKKIEQNPAWSEEDKNFMYDTLSNLTELKDRYGEGYGNVGRCIDWLKSLKQRIGWKPSDEQMEVLLSEVTAWTKGCPKQIILESLYNDLKKLKA